MTNLKSKILAIDYGTKIIGTAVNETEIGMCLPYIEIRNDDNKLNKIKDIVNEENITEIVIGFPVTKNNYVSERHQLILDFKNELETFLNHKLPIVFFDESYTTKDSINQLREFNIKTSKLKKNKDMLAASIILENYLKTKLNK